MGPPRSRAAGTGLILPALLLLPLLLIIPAAVLAAQAMDGSIGADEYPNILSRGDGSYLLAWRIQGRLIQLAMSAETEGWVGLAIGPIVLLDNGDFIYGWIDAEGTVQTRDAEALGPRGPVVRDTTRGGSDDILAAAGTREGGRTTIEIVRLLDTGDPHDAPIRPQGGNRILWAYGPDPAAPGRMRQYGEAYLRPGEELRPANWWANVTSTPLYPAGLTLAFLLQATALALLRLRRAGGADAKAGEAEGPQRAKTGDGATVRRSDGRLRSGHQLLGWSAAVLAGALALTVLLAPHGPLTLSALWAVVAAGTGAASLTARTVEWRARARRGPGSEARRVPAILGWVSLLLVAAALGIAQVRGGVF